MLHTPETCPMVYAVRLERRNSEGHLTIYQVALSTDMYSKRRGYLLTMVNTDAFPGLGPHQIVRSVPRGSREHLGQYA